jgi:hypothetical protein
MNQVQFYDFIDINGKKMTPAINNIASIVSLFDKVEITLNLKDRNNNFIVFVAVANYDTVIKDIDRMLQNQDCNLDDSQG